MAEYIHFEILSWFRGVARALNIVNQAVSTVGLEVLRTQSKEKEQVEDSELEDPRTWN